jgi:outer membrane protein assembly factor BamB
LVASGRVIFGAWDGRLHAVDLKTGSPVWSWPENGSFYYSPAGCAPSASAGNVLVCAPDGFVSAVRLDSGTTAWRIKLAAWESLGLSADGRRVLVKGRTDEFIILDAADGSILRSLSPAHGGDLLPGEPSDGRGRVLFGSQNGRVYSFRSAGPVEPVLDLGPGGVLAVVPLGGDRFAAADLDGRIVVFRLPE